MSRLPNSAPKKLKFVIFCKWRSVSGRQKIIWMLSSQAVIPRPLTPAMLWFSTFKNCLSPRLSSCAVPLLGEEEMCPLPLEVLSNITEHRRLATWAGLRLSFVTYKSVYITLLALLWHRFFFFPFWLYWCRKCSSDFKFYNFPRPGSVTQCSCGAGQDRKWQGWADALQCGCGMHIQCVFSIPKWALSLS